MAAQAWRLWRGERCGSRTVCVRDGERKGEVLKTCHRVRSDAAHGHHIDGLCSRVPSVAWLMRFGRAGHAIPSGEGKVPHATVLLIIVCISNCWSVNNSLLSLSDLAWQLEHIEYKRGPLPMPSRYMYVSCSWNAELFMTVIWHDKDDKPPPCSRPRPWEQQNFSRERLVSN